MLDSDVHQSGRDDLASVRNVKRRVTITIDAIGAIVAARPSLRRSVWSLIVWRSQDPLGDRRRRQCAILQASRVASRVAVSTTAFVRSIEIMSGLFSSSAHPGAKHSITLCGQSSEHRELLSCVSDQMRSQTRHKDRDPSAPGIVARETTCDALKLSDERRTRRLTAAMLAVAVD